MKQELDKKTLIEVDEDYIESPRYGNSLSSYLEKNEGKETPNSSIAKMLMISESEVEATYLSAIAKLKNMLT